MRKTILILCLFLLLLVTLISCKKEDQQFAAKIVGLSGSVPEIEAKSETEKQYGLFFDETQPKEYELNVHGESYKGNYYKSVLHWGFSTVSHQYYTEDGVSFDVEPDGTLIRIAWKKEIVPQSDVIELPEEEWIAQARNRVSDYLQVNVDDYVPSYRYDTVGDLHEICFKKYLNGIETMDYVLVKFELNGHTFSVNGAMLGKLPSEVDRTFDLEAAKSAVEKRCDELTAGVRDSFDTIEYTNWRFQLTIDEDGRFVLWTTVSIDCSIDYEDSRQVYSERADFFQYI